MGSYKRDILDLLRKYNFECSEISYKRIYNKDQKQESVIMVPVLMANELNLPGTESEKLKKTQEILEREKTFVAGRLFDMVQNIIKKERADIEIPDLNDSQHAKKVAFVESALFSLEVISPYDMQYRSDIEIEKEKVLGTRIQKGE